MITNMKVEEAEDMGMEVNMDMEAALVMGTEGGMEGIVHARNVATVKFI
jgi:hypothetical protein